MYKWSPKKESVNYIVSALLYSIAFPQVPNKDVTILLLISGVHFTPASVEARAVVTSCQWPL